MRLTDEEMKGLYQEQTARSVLGRAGCLSDELITCAAAGELYQSERENLADHFMSCSDCVKEYRLLRQAAPWAKQASFSIRENAFPDELSQTKLSGVKPHISPDRKGLFRQSWMRPFAGVYALGRGASVLAAVLCLVSVACVAWVIAARRENARIAARLNEQRSMQDHTSEALAETRRQLEEASRRAEQQGQEIAELRRSIDDLSQPQINIPIADLEMQGDRGPSESEITIVAVPGGAKLFTLILHMLDERVFPDYAVEAMDERNQRVWRAQGLRRSPADTFILSLPRSFLPAGRYRLKLYGVRAGKSESIGEYSMSLRYL